MKRTDSVWICAVPVATIWTSPESARKLDAPGVGNPQSMNHWMAAMTADERFQLFEENRVQSQLVYGEPVLVESIRDDWAYVLAVWQRSAKDARGYPGWVPLAQLQETEPLDEPIGVVRVDTPVSQLWHLDGSPAPRVVPFNTILPKIEERADWVMVASPNGDRLLRKEDVCEASSVHYFKKHSPQAAAERAAAFLDVPYFWGGMSPYGYDCSGLTYNMFKACGLYISRDAGDQAAEGKEIPMDRPSDWRRGDLLFFGEEDTSAIDHVGFYYGEGQMIHATSRSAGAVEFTILAETPYAKRLRAVRRYSEETGRM